MKAAGFGYHRPETMAELLTLLADLPDARIIAGGQSLMPMMNFRIAMPQHLVDIEKIDGLDSINLRDGTLQIGAMVRQADALASPVIKENCPVLADAIAHIGHQQTRNRGTVGGSLCHLDPASEIPLVCALLDAQLYIASRRGTRMMNFRDFAVAPLTTSLAEDEILTHIDLPICDPDTRHGFGEYARRSGDFAVVAVATHLRFAGETITEARMAFAGLGTIQARADRLEMFATSQKLSPALIDKLAQEAAQMPAESDLHHDADYKRHLAACLLREVLERILRHG